MYRISSIRRHYYFFAACFCVATIQGRHLFLWKAHDINYSWIRELKCLVWGVRTIQWRLLDAVIGTSNLSLSVLLSAVETSRTTLMLARWPSSETTHIGVHVPHIPAAATVKGQRLFKEIHVWYYYVGADLQILNSTWSQMPWPLQALFLTHIYS